MRRVQGFTLLELIIVMVVAGILAAFALARLNTRDFDAIGFADRVQQMVRYAQKAAVAERRHVCVAITPGSVAVTLQTAPGAFSACDGSVRDPASGDPLVANAPAGVTLAVSGGPGSFAFDPLGRPGLAARLTVTVSGGDVSSSFHVEPETGLVQG